MIGARLQRRREREDRIRMRYESGFDYAAGQLLRGVPPATLEQSDTGAIFSRDVFDKGMRAAIAAHRAKR